MAAKLGLPSTGIVDKELTIDTNNFLNKLIEMDEGSVSQIIETSPPLTILAASFVVYGLFKKYQKKEISKKKFLFLSAKMTGLKAAKIVMLLSLLTLPVVGQIVGAYLIYILMIAALGVIDVTKDQLMLPDPTQA